VFVAILCLCKWHSSRDRISTSGGDAALSRVVGQTQILGDERFSLPGTFHPCRSTGRTMNSRQKIGKENALCRIDAAFLRGRQPLQYTIHFLNVLSSVPSSFGMKISFTLSQMLLNAIQWGCCIRSPESIGRDQKILYLTSEWIE
jgi:hypothetical protein